MSATTTTTPEPTARMAEAVRLRDEGKSNAEIGELMGTTAGTAGNNVVNGLRRMGREAEVTSTPSGGGGGRVGKVRDAVSLVEAELARVDSVIDRHRNREVEAREHLDTIMSDPAAWIAGREADLTEAVEEARNVLKAFKSNAEAEHAAQVEAVTANVDEVAKAVAEAVAEVEAERAGLVAARDALAK